MKISPFKGTSESMKTKNSPCKNMLGYFDVNPSFLMGRSTSKIISPVEFCDEPVNQWPFLGSGRINQPLGPQARSRRCFSFFTMAPQRDVFWENVAIRQENNYWTCHFLDISVHFFGKVITHHISCQVLQKLKGLIDYFRGCCCYCDGFDVQPGTISNFYMIWIAKG